MVAVYLFVLKNIMTIMHTIKEKEKETGCSSLKVASLVFAFPLCWELNSRKDSILNAILCEWISYPFCVRNSFKRYFQQVSWLVWSTSALCKNIERL